MPPSSIAQPPIPGTLLQRWPTSRQLNSHSTSGSSASASAAQPVVPTNRPATFSQCQFALSFYMERSKRDELTSIENCRQILKHAKLGRQRSAEDYMHIDTRDYWREACNRIHTEKEALEAKILRLEEEKRLLVEKYRGIEGPQEEEYLGPGNGILRGEGGSSRRMEAGTSKKRSAPFQEFLENQSDVSDVDDDIDLRMRANVIRINRQQTQLETAIHQASTLDQINHLANCVIQMISMLDKAVPDCCLPLKSLKVNNEDSNILRLLQFALQHIERSFLTCFASMNQIFSTIPGRLKQREITSCLIMFFQKSLDFFSTVSALQSEDEHVQRVQSTRSKRAKSDTAEYAVNKYLARTLASIAMRMDWKEGQIGHSEVLEGILVASIRRTGQFIKDAVFGNDVPKLESIIRPETRYVVQILYATLGGPDRKELVSRVLSQGQTPQNSSSGHNAPGGSGISGQLLKKVRKQLQDILIHTTLGGVDPDSLQLPGLPSDMDKVEDTRDKEERYGKEWLLETVWGLVGWDMVTPKLIRTR